MSASAHICFSLDYSKDIPHLSQYLRRQITLHQNGPGRVAVDPPHLRVEGGELSQVGLMFGG